jgi:hypothetical protein
MADLELKGVLDLEVNAKDLADEIESAGKDAGGGGGAGGGGVFSGVMGKALGFAAIGAVVGLVVKAFSELLKITTGLVKTIVMLPKTTMDIARTFADASPRLRRAFALFDRSMFLFRRRVGEMIAPAIGGLLQAVAAEVNRNADLFAKAIIQMAKASVEVIQMLQVVIPKLLAFLDQAIEKTGNYVRDARLGAMFVQEKDLAMRIKQARLYGDEATARDLERQLRELRTKANRVAQGIDPDSPTVPERSPLDKILDKLGEILHEMEVSRDKDDLNRLDGENFEQQFMNSLGNFLGPPPDAEQMRRMINPGSPVTQET